MSENTKKAKQLLQKASQEFRELCGLVSTEQPLDEDAKAIYQATAKLDILASQLVYKDCQKVIEDVIKVDNGKAMIDIGGIELRDDMEFELLHNGEWVKGRRDNSQYGQIFVSEGVTETIVNGVSRGRVITPLKAYEPR